MKRPLGGAAFAASFRGSNVKSPAATTTKHAYGGRCTSAHTPEIMGDDGLLHAPDGEIVLLPCEDCGQVGPEDPDAADRVVTSQDGRPRCDACDAAWSAK